MKVNIYAIKAKTSEALDKTKKFAGDAKNKVVETGSKIVKEAPEAYEVSKEKVVKAMDQNGDGELTIEDVIIAGLKFPV